MPPDVADEEVEPPLRAVRQRSGESRNVQRSLNERPLEASVGRSEKVKEVRVDGPRSGIDGTFIPHSGHSPLAERMASLSDRSGTEAPQLRASVLNPCSFFGGE